MDVYDFLVLATLAVFFIYQIYRWVMDYRSKSTNHEPIDKNTPQAIDDNYANASDTLHTDALHTENEVQLTPTHSMTTDVHAQSNVKTQDDIQSENDLLTIVDAEQVGAPANNSDYASHSEDIDISDMTIDVSEMLKELNLRESDSARLDIDKTQYRQLKTGEPGEVSPDTIETVAGKLRNMLH